MKQAPFKSLSPGDLGENDPWISSGIEIMRWRKSRKMNRETLAKLANCSVRKLATYEKAEELPISVKRQTTEALRLLQALEEIIPDARLADWLNAPNPGFQNRPPLSVITSGESDLLWEMIYQTRESAFA